MNILKKHPLPALLLLAVLVLAGYLAFLIPSGYQLQLRDRKADELIAAWPIAPGDKLSLEIEHSFEHIPWYEYYSVTDGLEFNLDAIAVGGLWGGDPRRDGRAHPGGGRPGVDGGHQQSLPHPALDHL